MNLKNVYGFMAVWIVLGVSLQSAMGEDAKGINNSENKNNSDCECPNENRTSSCSVNLSIPCGQLKYESLIKSARLMIEEHQPSALTATPQSLNLIAGDYSLKSVREVGGAKEVEALLGGGKALYFNIPSGSTQGIPVGLSAGRDERIEVVTENSIDYFDLLDGSGNRYRFFGDDAQAANYLSLKSIRVNGKEQDAVTQMGLEVIRVDGVISQVKTPSRLLNVVNEGVAGGVNRFRVDIYPDWQVNPKSGDSYPVPSNVPMESWVVANPSSTELDVVLITQKVGYDIAIQDYLTQNITRYVYASAIDAWTMSVDGDSLGIYNRYTQEQNPSQDQRINTREIGRYLGTVNQVIDFKTVETTQLHSWGMPVVRREESVGVGKPDIVTTYS